MAMSIEFLFFTEMDILFTYFLFTYLFIFWLQDDKIILLDLFLFLIAINQITFFLQSFYIKSAIILYSAGGCNCHSSILA